jgi:hypothetical protein
VDDQLSVILQDSINRLNQCRALLRDHNPSIASATAQIITIRDNLINLQQHNILADTKPAVEIAGAAPVDVGFDAATAHELLALSVVGSNHRRLLKMIINHLEK